MANVIGNFLVGIGVKFDKRSAGEVTGALDSIKSQVLQLGAVAAGAFGVKALTTGFTEATNKLNNFSNAYKLLPTQVSALGRVAQQTGGNLDSVMGQLANIEKMRAGLQVGDAGWTAAVGRAGIDPAVITQSKDSVDVLLNLADRFQSMSRDQRINAADALGFDESTLLMLSQGRQNLEQVLRRQQELRPVTIGMTDAAAGFNKELIDLEANVGGVADTISEKLLPQATLAVTKFNEWVEANKSLTGTGIDKTLEVIGDNMTPIATALGVITGVAVINGLAKVVGYLVGMRNALIIGGATWLGDKVFDAAKRFNEGKYGAGTSTHFGIETYNGSLVGRGLSWADQQLRQARENKYQYNLQRGNLTPAQIAAHDAAEVAESERQLQERDDAEVAETERQLRAAGKWDSPATKAIVAQHAQRTAMKGSRLLDSLDQTFGELEKQNGLPRGLLRAIAQTESSGDPNARSAVGAQGLFQFMPDTALEYGLRGDDVFDPKKSAAAAAKYLSRSYQMFNGDTDKVIASYNAGMGAVGRRGLDNLPSETMDYVPKVYRNWGQGGSNAGGAGDVNVTLQLDGQVLDKRTIRVMSDAVNQTHQEIQNSTKG